MTAIDTQNTIGDTTGTGGTKRNTSGVLGKDDFLKLLVAQLQHQDPMQPSGDKEFIAQMTQFSMLEQLTNISQGQQAATNEQHTSQTLSLIGRTVTYVKAGEDGTLTNVTGVVQSVTFGGGAPTLTVDGVTGVSPATITEVK